jgi:hypothetical protein
VVYDTDLLIHVVVLERESLALSHRLLTRESQLRHYLSANTSRAKQAALRDQLRYRDRCNDANNREYHCQFDEGESRLLAEQYLSLMLFARGQEFWALSYKIYEERLGISADGPNQSLCQGADIEWIQ